MFHRTHIVGLSLAFCVAASCAAADPAQVVSLANVESGSPSQEVRDIVSTDDTPSPNQKVSGLTSSDVTSDQQNVRRAVTSDDRGPADQRVMPQ